MSQTQIATDRDTDAVPDADRRAFFTAALGAAAIGAGAVALATPAAAQSVYTEVDALNFILQLEYLQANYFSYATSGAALAAADISGINTTAGTTVTPGAATGGRAVTFADANLASFAKEMAADDLANVRFLRTVLTSPYATAQPAIDLGATSGGFSGLWNAAGLGATFDPYAGENNFLLGAFMLKDVVVTAIAGVMGNVTTLGYVEAMAGMMAVQAHHAATIRATLYRRGLSDGTLIDRSEAISAARDALDGATTDLDQGVRAGTSASGATVANLAPIDGNGIAFSRTPIQVLNIVYVNAASAITSGGFFTAGLNGTLKSTAATTTS